MHISFDHFSILEDMLSVHGMVVLSNDFAMFSCISIIAPNLSTKTKLVPIGVGKKILLGFHLFQTIDYIQISKVIPMHTNNTSCFQTSQFFPPCLMQNVMMQLCKSCNLGFELNHCNMFAWRLKGVTYVSSFTLIMMTILVRNFVKDSRGWWFVF